MARTSSAQAHREKKSPNQIFLVSLLVIQGIERFFWMQWFLSLELRTTTGAGLLLGATYTLPIVFAPLVSRIGSGRGVLAGMLMYAFGFLVAPSTPELGIYLIVVASAIHKSAFAPTISEFGDDRVYTLLYFAVNGATGASSFAYGWLRESAGLSGMDGIACASFLVASLFALTLRRVVGARSAAGSGNVFRLVRLGLCQLPIFICIWKFQTDYRTSLNPLFVSAGLPEGSLWGTVCIVTMFCSIVLGNKKFAGFLKDGSGVLFLGALTFVAYFTMAGLTAKHSLYFHFGVTHIILAEVAIFALADSLVGAVSQRLMIEAAPTKAWGSGAYFCLVGSGALLSYLMGTPEKPLLFVLAGLALLTPLLLIVLESRGEPIT